MRYCSIGPNEPNSPTDCLTDLAASSCYRGDSYAYGK